MWDFVSSNFVEVSKATADAEKNNFTFDIKYSKVGIAEFLIHLSIMSALENTL